MHRVGFEPTKRIAVDLKSTPFDQTRVSLPMLVAGLEPATSGS